MICKIIIITILLLTILGVIKVEIRSGILGQVAAKIQTAVRAILAKFKKKDDDNV